jgi:hypothetical protein
MKALIGLYFIVFPIFFPVTANAKEILTIPSDSGYKILSISPEELLEGITAFSLGSVGYLTALKDYGLILGNAAKKNGANGVIIGIAKTIRSLEDNDFLLFSNSPWLTAEALNAIAEGVVIAGVFPFLNLEQGYELDILKGLVSRNSYPCLLCLSTSIDRDASLSELLNKNRWRPLYMDTRNDSEKAVYHEFTWDYSLSAERIEEIRRTLLVSSIVLIKKPTFATEIQIIDNPNTTVQTRISYIIVRDPLLIPQKNVQGAVLIPSNEPFLIEEAKAILNGLKTAKGKKNW